MTVTSGPRRCLILHNGEAEAPVYWVSLNSSALFHKLLQVSPDLHTVHVYSMKSRAKASDSVSSPRLLIDERKTQRCLFTYREGKTLMFHRLR